MEDNEGRFNNKKRNEIIWKMLEQSLYVEEKWFEVTKQKSFIKLWKKHFHPNVRIHNNFLNTSYYEKFVMHLFEGYSITDYRWGLFLAAKLLSRNMKLLCRLCRRKRKEERMKVLTQLRIHMVANHIDSYF